MTAQKKYNSIGVVVSGLNVGSFLITPVFINGAKNAD